MRPLLILCGFVIGFCLAGVLYAPMMRRAHDTANYLAESAENWRNAYCATVEGRQSMVCQQYQPPIVKPTSEWRDRNPKILL